MEATSRFTLPLLSAGQAQKEMFHNEALVRVDALLHPCVEAAAINIPPSDPDAGAMWIVGSAPVGGWAGAADQLAIATPGGWRFLMPREGMQVVVRDSGLTATWIAGVWQVGTVHALEFKVAGERVIGERQAGIADAAGGSVIDGEARVAINAMLSTMRAHGLIAA